MDGPRAVRHLSTHLHLCGGHGPPSLSAAVDPALSPLLLPAALPHPCPGPSPSCPSCRCPLSSMAAPALLWSGSCDRDVSGRSQRAPDKASVRLFLFSAQNAPVTPISTQVPPGSYETLLALPRCRALSARSRWRCSWLGGLASLSPLPGPLAGSLCAGMSLGPSDPAVQCVLCDPALYTRCGLQKAEEQGRPSRLERGASG